MLSWLANKTGLETFLDATASSSYLPEGSIELSENVNQLQAQPASLRDPWSLLVGVNNFLFVPTPFIDNGSFFLNIQSYESFAWYLYYIILIFLLIRLLQGRYVLNLATLSSALFSLGFILLSALVEVNDGTSVRHRSVLLISILVMLATFQTSKRPQLKV
jgi:peptidoglycan/LPS O-acetylase OafA/YrhL